MSAEFNSQYEERLTSLGIRPTAIRIMVLRAISEDPDGIISIADLANRIGSLDTSTIFRTLSLFSEHHLVHEVDDGSGTQKYCVCHCADLDHHHGHIHLTCTRCHKTVCLRDVPIPAVPLPSGFLAEESEYIVKGLCQSCGKVVG